ncbi:hypothetical protein HK097_006077 [Rhizophlyctis rosea]|uniref:PRA1 family protein n=1 Tax=Rhizophlyctis rosea TaxID=64517 RepID=A0AAD5X5V2_9FUNG|nr:hypothetical protein HK097_006077 [Rhizophlyctis rosea]
MVTVATSAASRPDLGSYVRIDPQTWETVKAQGQARFAGLKPVSEFFDRNRMSKPQSLNVFTTRLNFNLIYFQNNYILITLLCTIYLLFTNLSLLLGILFLIGAFKFVNSMNPNEPTRLPGGVMVTRTQLYPALVFIAILVLWFTSATSAIFWLASVCAFIIAIHAGFMEPPVEAEFAEQQV